MKQPSANKQLRERIVVLQRQMVKLEALSARTLEEFARFFTQSLDLLCIAGVDGYFERLNPAWTTRLGWTLEELKARPFLHFVHADDRSATQEEVGKLAQGAETILFENRYRHHDGSYRWLQWNARSVPGGQRIYAAARDVTRRRRLEREILEIADREKARLGRELHDGLCQSLAGIAALSSTLSRRLAASSESAASAAAAEVNTLLNETIRQARDLARGLGPVGLKQAGLEGALETLASNVQRLFSVSCTFECDRPFLRFHHDAEAHLLRIAQQAVNNAISHGRADRIEIALSCKNGKGLLDVRDDGVGLPEEKACNPDGIGLDTMAYRARLIGASLEARRRTRRGTTVTCVFPLPRTSDARENPDHVA